MIFPTNFWDLKFPRLFCSPADTSSNHSIGIRNVQQRIQSYYGKEYGLTIDSFPGQGTLIDIALPYGKKPALPCTEQNKTE